MIARQQLGPKDEISTAGINHWQRVDQWQADRLGPITSEPKPDDAAAAKADGTSNELSPPTQNSGAETGEWYVAIEGERHGPIDEHTLGRWISERRINAQTLVWRTGMHEWSTVREALPAALISSPTTSIDHTSLNLSPSSVEVNREDQNYALRDLRSRRLFWILSTCVITYIFSAESFALGIFQIYTAVATRRVENSGLVALWALSSLVFAILLLMAAIAMTKLLGQLHRQYGSDDSVAIARHEHRVWMFAGLSMAFIIANQIVFAIFLLFTIAQAT
ncbi:DUF4339 domain-containing protein [Stieleria sp. JC731]|nr:DUF4339 domain-containing protein [Stieleria sp. JC731]